MMWARSSLWVWKATMPSESWVGAEGPGAWAVSAERGGCGGGAA